MQTLAVGTILMLSWCIHAKSTVWSKRIDKNVSEGLEDVFLHWNNLSLELELTIQYENGETVTTVVERGDSANDLVNLCQTVTGSDCTREADEISRVFYNKVYTPTSRTHTLEDELSTRTDVLRYLINLHDYQSYLEIGCYENQNFNQIIPLVHHAVGVDPEQGGTLRMKSDAFFASNSEYFDIIFIDGFHEAKQVARDIDNALKWLNPGGVIVMHDCNSRFESTQRVRANDGRVVDIPIDVYKAAVAMRLRQDIEIIVVDIDHGVGIIQRRDNTHPLPHDILTYLSQQIHSSVDGDAQRSSSDSSDLVIDMLDFEYFDANRDTLLRLMSLSDAREWMMNVGTSRSMLW